MNILFLTHRLPYPPNKGDKIRSFNILKHLARKHDVSLACVIDSKTDLQYIQHLKDYCRTIDWVEIAPRMRRLISAKAIFKRQPLSVAYFYSKDLQRRINRRLRETTFDLIFTYSSPMAEYVKSVMNTRRIMDFVDVDSRKWKQYACLTKNVFSKWFYHLEVRRLAAYEKWIAQSFDASLVVSDTEAYILKRTIIDDATVKVIHNGVDYEFFNFNDKKNGTTPNSNSDIILFTGAMDYYPNIDAVMWFAVDIFPIVKKAKPDAKFYVVGSNPASKIKKLNDDADIFVTGYVEDVRDFFNKATVCVAPFRIACGIQNKILEALSMGLPVVTSSLGFKGLKATQCPVLVSDDPEAFAQQVVTLLQESKRGSRESSKYRKWIIEHYDWQKNLSEIDNLCEASR